MKHTDFRRVTAPVNWPRRIAEHLASIEPGDPAQDLAIIRHVAMGYRLTDFMQIQRARVLLRGARNDWDDVTYEGQTALIKALEVKSACASDGPSPV